MQGHKVRYFNYRIAGFFRRRKFQTSSPNLNFRELNFVHYSEFKN